MWFNVMISAVAEGRSEAHLLFAGFSVPGCTKAGRKPFSTYGHRGKIDSMTLPGAVFLTVDLGSFVVMLQRQYMQVPEQIGRVSF